MPDLNFQVTGVEAVERSLTPLLHFKLQITTANPSDCIQGLLISAQIQILSPQRHYTSPEKERLVDLFGAPEKWGQTLRNRLWINTHCTVGAFSGTMETILPVACTFDLNIAATKYFYALEGGEVPLLFLFSGSVFYPSAEGQLQVERISWNKECLYRMPVENWRQLMEQHYPNAAWLYLKRELFDRLYSYRRQNGMATWEQTIESLLDEEEAKHDFNHLRRDDKKVPV